MEAFIVSRIMHYLHQRRRAPDRQVRAHFALSIEMLVALYSRYQLADLPVDHLLLALHFLRVYPTEDTGAPFFRITGKTYKKRRDHALLLLHRNLPPVCMAFMLILIR